MPRRERRARPAWLQILLAAAGLLLFAGAYVLAMRLALDTSRVESLREANDRDVVYLGIHTGLLVVCGVVGFALGKWLSGMGVAFGLLFVVVLSVSMVGAQMGSYELACQGHNDVIRHWTC
jgi:hypothetical protein